MSADTGPLQVPFWHQLDNRFEPHRTCNTSSCAMAAKFLGAKISSDDEYFQIVRRYGDTTDHGAQTKALASLGIKSTWHTNLDFADLDKSLAQGLPVVIAILHRGPPDNPTGGHVLVVIGKTGQDYYCHDPYGAIPYQTDVMTGKNVVYSRKMLTNRWLVRQSKSGWGRLFQR